MEICTKNMKIKILLIDEESKPPVYQLRNLINSQMRQEPYRTR